jgi:putative addiction module component (TIGR02574 family)
MQDLLEKALMLPLRERIRFADALYESVGDPPGLPLTDAQIDELERRLQDYKLHPETSISAEEFFERYKKC